MGSCYIELSIIAACDDGAGNEISFTNESGYGLAIGRAINLLWGAHLSNGSVIQNRYSIRNGQCFFLIVSDINSSEPRILADSPNFTAHLKTQFGIEIG